MVGSSSRSAIRRSYTRATTPAYIDRLFTSWLLPTWLFAAWRVLVAIYMFTVQFFILGYDSTHGMGQAASEDFAYFTVLTYWGMAFYYAFSAAHTVSFAVKSASWLRQWPGWLQWMHSVLYSTITVYPFIVTAVYWAVLSEGAFKSQFTTWSNISQHALNSVLAFCEIVLPMSEPHPWFNMLPIVVILACYLGLAYLVQAVDGFYVYSFLNPQNGRALVAGACIGILVGTMIVFVVVRYLVWFRSWVTESKLKLDQRLPEHARRSAAAGGHEYPANAASKLETADHRDR